MSLRLLDIIIAEDLAQKTPSPALIDSLHNATFSGRPGHIRKILTAFPDLVDTPDDIGWTPLMRAAFMADVESVQVLLYHGADISRRAPDRNTPVRMEPGRGNALEIARASDFYDEESLQRQQQVMEVLEKWMADPRGCWQQLDAAVYGTDIHQGIAQPVPLATAPLKLQHPRSVLKK